MDTINQDMILLTQGIIQIYHKPLIRDIAYIRGEIDVLISHWGEKISSLSTVQELFEQFAKQVTQHMEHEEQEFFPVLCEVEECYTGSKKYDKCDLERFDKVIRRLEQDHEEFDTYVYDLVEVFNNIDVNYIDRHMYDRCKKILESLEKDVMHHTQIENMKLHIIAREKYNVLCG